MRTQSVGSILDDNFNFAISYSQADCSEHGLSEHWRVGSMKPVCRQCEASQKEKQAQENIGKIYEKYKSTMTAFGVNPDGKKFDDWTFDSGQKERQQKIISVLQNIADNFKLSGLEDRNNSIKNILLIGGTGSGKTMLANALAKEIYRRAAKIDVAHQVDHMRAAKPHCELITSSDITNKAKQAWGEYGNSEQQVIDGLADRALLIIDDLGDNDTASNADMAAADRNRISTIIGKRYQKKPTVITTNLTAEQVKDFLGDRAWDRLQENLIIIKCDWASYRQANAKVLML